MTFRPHKDRFEALVSLRQEKLVVQASVASSESFKSSLREGMRAFCTGHWSTAATCFMTAITTLNRCHVTPSEGEHRKK